MNIVYYPNEILAEPAYPVAEDYPEGELRQIIGDMKILMYKYKGVGLAAPQVGLPMQLFVMDQQVTSKGKDFKFFINPVIEEVSTEGKIIAGEKDREGCLSAPGFSTLVLRQKLVGLSWEDTSREKKYSKFSGREAQIIQHEMDHLYGKCIVDKAPDAQRIHYLSLLK